MIETENQLLPIGPMARHLRVSVAWLREEAEARRVPRLQAGRVFLFDPVAVQQALLERARQSDDHGGAEMERAAGGAKGDTDV